MSDLCDRLEQFFEGYFRVRDERCANKSAKFDRERHLLRGMIGRSQKLRFEKH